METINSTSEIFERIAREEHFKIDNDFRGKDIISIEQLNPHAIEIVMIAAKKMETLYKEGRREEYCHLLEGKRLMVNFAQPSTRTYSSFCSAALELGAMVVGIPEALQSSSYTKGETIEDTMRTYEALRFSGIIMRHPDDDSTLKAALAIEIPVISGGSGKLEHPTQALLDLYTILEETGGNLNELDKLTVSFVGDLKNGRTVHSLMKLLVQMGVKNINGVSPASLMLPDDTLDYLRKYGVNLTEAATPEVIIGNTDVLYVTRVQKEWLDGVDHHELANSYRITPELLSLAKPDITIMHPLPRNDELPTSIDKLAGAAYFRQVENGLYVRMALLYLILGNY